MTTSENTATLLRFIAELTPESIPTPVWLRIEDLFLDWLGSALASKHTHPIPALTNLASQMGPSSGSCQVLTTSPPTTSSAYWAAWTNAAASHTLEQDDLHNSSVMHPATVIFPAVLAAAQDNSSHVTPQQLLLASIAGYEAGVRIAEALGRNHYRVFHTTATAGTMAAALAVAKLLDEHNETLLLAALGSAGTQTSGLWAFLRNGAAGAGDSKQVHCAHAASTGLLSAYLARDGVRAAADVVEGAAGVLEAMGLGGESTAGGSLLREGLGTRWAVLETSFKVHACCRHTHPAADALLRVLKNNKDVGGAAGVKRVVARVHGAALDVLGPVDAGPVTTVHAAKFSMKSVLALIAVRGSAGLADFEEAALTDEAVLAFRDKVVAPMVLDEEVDAAYPARWLGRVEVEMEDGRVVEGRCDVPRGDPGNSLTRAELEDKFRMLVAYGGGDKEEADTLIEWCWGMRDGGSSNCMLPLGGTKTMKQQVINGSKGAA